MKAIKILTLTLLTLMNLPFNACAKDDGDHTLTKLWAEYQKAVDADKPKDQADILERIKKEASEKHLAWDYYDATWKYVSARTSSNWKLRDELTAQANNDIEQFGEPVAVFYNRRGNSSADALFRYVTEQKDRLLQSHNPEFYSRDADVNGYKFSDALLYRIDNDYEYTLWSLLRHSRRDEAIANGVQEYYAGRYPFDAFIDFYLIQRESVPSVAEEKMTAYVSAHARQAVSMLGRDYLLQRRHSKLNQSKNPTSEEYRQLANDCQTLIADRKKFTGEEHSIAKCTDNADSILDILTSQEASVDVEKGVATFVVRNLPSLNVRVLDGKREVFSSTVQNPVKSFYLRDTLTLNLPANLDDKTYTLKCTGGKVETTSEYRRYSLSIASKRDLDGYGIYVADYITGEPVKSCDVFLYDDDGKQVDSVTGLAIDGFTYLPESFTKHLDDDHFGFEIQAVTRMAGRVRATPRHYFYYEEREAVSDKNPGLNHAMVITDRSAFNPDETVHYKVLLYKGTYEYETRPEGIQLHVTLTDPTGKEIGEQDLTTNEFGTAAGAFVLKKGERGGMYRITVSEGKSTIASTQVRADEFVLPTFELTWKPNDRFYLPLDNVVVEGNIRSYSGHNLGTATATYLVSDYGNGNGNGSIAQGKLELAPSGDFKIRFQAPLPNYSSSNVQISVRVTDATGETLEFNNSVSVSRYIPLQIRVDNQVPGRFEATGRYSGGSIIGENTARVRFQVGYGRTLTHPDLKIEYKVLREGKEILSGTAPNGEIHPIDLSAFPSGLYNIEAVVTAKSDHGEVFDNDASYQIVKAADTDTALDLDVRCFFKEMADDGTGIALQIGTTAGPTWVVAELYGDGNRLLEKRLVKLAGVRGKPGSLQIIRFDRKDDYPENLSLKVFWFRDGQSYTYSVTSYKPKARLQLPLSFSRFLDTTAPHHDYSFTILTAEGTEVAATIFDKSTETIQRNVWQTVSPSVRYLPDVDYRRTVGVDESYAFDNEVVKGFGRGRVLAKAAGAVEKAVMMEDSYMATAEMVDEEAVATNDMGAGGEEEAEVSIRENFANTIAWEPFLRSDKDGVVTFNFTTADKLSTYYVQLFAHDKAFHNATIRQEMVVTLPVKVALVQPQYLYEGDRYVARVTVSNSKGVPVAGRISVKFLNGTDYKTAPVVSEKSQHISVPANGSADFSCEITAPVLKNLGLLVSFTADSAEFGSDGVFVAMPVSPAVQTITEAHSALLLAGMDREALLADLRSQFVNVSGAEAALREISILGMIQEAIPEKVLPASENLLDQSESLYANYLIDKLPGSQGSAATAEQRADMVKKILACRYKDGGFGWFPGMDSSPILTATLLERLADMGDACPEELASVLPDAVKYLDKNFLGDRKRPFWCSGISLDQYLHVRSMYPEVKFAPTGVGAKVLRDFKKETKSYLVPGKKRGLNGRVFAKARRLKTLRALVVNEKGASLAKSWGIALFTSKRLRKSLQADIESLLQYAEPHRSGGTYYPNAVMPWRGLLESELYAHALICDLLTDCGHSEVAEGIRLWIMVQKETQQWEDDPAYIQAIGSVLRGTEETLQTKVLALSASTTLPFQQIKASGNGFTVRRTFTRNGEPLKDGDVLHVGDKVSARYEIWNEENRSFVRLTATRPAAFRPVDQLSGRYGWTLRPISITGWMTFSPQGYRSVLSDRTEYWFDAYPEENTTLHEEYFVTQEGTFQSPVPVIESLYAPHYRANDDGKPAITILPQEE